MTGLITIRACG